MGLGMDSLGTLKLKYDYERLPNKYSASFKEPAATVLLPDMNCECNPCRFRKTKSRLTCWFKFRAQVQLKYEPRDNRWLEAVGQMIKRKGIHPGKSLYHEELKKWYDKKDPLMVWYYLLLHEEVHVSYMERWYKSRLKEVKKRHGMVFSSDSDCQTAKLKFQLEMAFDAADALLWHDDEIHLKNSSNTPIPPFGKIPQDNSDSKSLNKGD